jgi:hypothetical protein
MAFDFPNSPVLNEVFTDAATGKQYVWNGFAWGKGYTEPPVGVTHPPAETIPVEPPIDGETSVDAVLRSLSADLTQVQNDAGQKVAKAGNTEGIMTGILTLSEHPTAASGEFQAATKGFVSSIAGLPPTTGGLPGQALVLDALNVPAWGAPIAGGNF